MRLSAQAEEISRVDCKSQIFFRRSTRDQHWLLAVRELYDTLMVV
jgi:hypothetical protein